MEQEKLQQLTDGVATAFVDKSFPSCLTYRPQFVSNNYKDGRKVLSSIEHELNNCDEFIISVAFVTMSGLTPLLQTLRELSAAGKRGKILTTDYLTFSEPRALEKLSQFENIELRMFSTEGKSEGFHTKGYIFKSHEIYTIIIGSSNITISALTRNKEWNSRLVSTEAGEYANEVLSEFDQIWNAPNTIPYGDFIDFYKTKYDLVKSQQLLAKQSQPIQLETYKLSPNDMQVHFVNNIRALRNAGEKRALLISATGTGKTYASAFCLRDCNPKRALFIVHRETIARQAIASYKKVFGKTKTFGLLSGTSKDFESDFLFATMNMMAKEEVRKQFSKNEFDTIIIDEVHRAGADSYQGIMAYFEPNFWLGMTASPDRTDGYDIYALFDHNIAYEIRLQQALEADLLCPFHYFGISDLEIDGVEFNDKTGVRNFEYLVSNERVEHVLAQLTYFGYSGPRPKGLIFCSRKEEARELSSAFNLRGYKTEFLCGEDSGDYREECIDRLTSGDRKDYLEYIFTVDIFNEGVDIPDVNQIVMLRPTESPIVFIQQLGRGLRKAEGKEYVVVLDFIGNYLNNFMIPIALSGDRSYNKDTIRRYVREGTKVIPGSSTIHFDEISRKRIYASIDTITTTKKLLTDKYLLLRYKLGRIPSICDFYEYSEIDPMLFIDYAGSYHNFLLKIGTKAEPAYKVKFSIKEANLLDFSSTLLANGKRPHELLIVRHVLDTGHYSLEKLASDLGHYGIDYDVETALAAIKYLQGQFINTQGEKSKYGSVGLIEFHDDVLVPGDNLAKAILTPSFIEQLKDVLDFGLKRFENIYLPEMDHNGLTLYQKYSRKDVCRLLNWEKDESSTMYGYRIKYNTCPIFVTYEKTEEVLGSSTGYQDAFVNNRQFSWMTRNRVTLEHDESQAIINSKKNGLRIMLFVKKSDGEGSDFYYMGQMTPKQWMQTTIKDKYNKDLPIMNFQFEMGKAIRDDIYDYFTA